MVPEIPAGPVPDLIELYLRLQRGERVDPELLKRTKAERVEGMGAVVLGLLKASRTWRDEWAFTPKPVATLIAQVAAVFPANSVLDPTCGTGALLHTVSEGRSLAVVHGIEINKTTAAIARLVLGEAANVVDGDLFAPHEGVLDRYDLIIADPPLGVTLRAHQPTGLLQDFRGQLCCGLAAWACERLNEAGAALIIVTPAVAWGREGEALAAVLRAAGGRIRALIHLPGGSLHGTSIESYLLVAERGAQEKVFVGQFRNDQGHRDQLVANLKRRKAGSEPSLGRLVDFEEFRGFEALAAAERARRLARVSKWGGVPANELICEHEVAGRRVPTLDHGAKSVYLKLSRRARATLDPEELGRSREVLHLHVNSERVDPHYLVRWFNDTEIGEATLGAAMRGGTIPRVDVVSLLGADFYLPALAEQRAILRLAGDIAGIRAAVDEIDSDLWAGAETPERIEDRLSSVNQGEGLEAWSETLPFPMATVLWRYLAANNATPRERYEALLHFFEATAAFLATLHISAFLSSPDLWEVHGRGLTQTLAKMKLSVDQSTFGSWSATVQYLSPKAEAFLSSPEPMHAELWPRLYGTHNRGLLEALTSKEIRRVLQRANHVRNTSLGHAGAISRETAEGVERELLELLSAIRGSFGRRWLAYELVQPTGQTTFDGRRRTQVVKRLMGNKSAPFATKKIETLEELWTDQLYLFDSTSQTGLRLRPLIRVIPSPERKAEACFIYSRRERTGSRFISYHFEQESEIFDESSEVEETLELLHQFDQAEEVPP